MITHNNNKFSLYKQKTTKKKNNNFKLKDSAQPTSIKFSTKEYKNSRMKNKI